MDAIIAYSVFLLFFGTGILAGIVIVVFEATMTLLLGAVWGLVLKWTAPSPKKGGDKDDTAMP